ncbi:hypothetical protein ACFXP7_05135 [Microbacterium sp. P06]|uniref:hypothetical protein n=1 Tax=Microbacterium sp. P06 TaxID=3366949 RepID=UPI003746E1FB
MSTPHDSLDDLLNRSAPAHGETADLHARFSLMVRDAQREAAPTRTPRAWRAAVGAGLGVLLVGGAGAAFASGIFNWEPWAEDPDISYSFTLPSGIDCETRILIDSAPAQGGNGIPTPSVGAEQFRSWAQTTDLFALADVDARLAELEQNGGMPADMAPMQPGEQELMVVVEPGGGLDVVPKTDGGPSADDLYAHAVDLAMTDVLTSKSAELGLDGTAGNGWSTSQQMLCGSE